MKKMDIVYEDKNLLVVNKPSGLLTIATEKEKYFTLYHEAREYVKKQNPKNKIFIVHRLDKDTSGIVVFAKNEKLKHSLQNNWNEICLTREYLAIVEGKVKKEKDTLKSYLKEDKTYRVYSTRNDGELAITHYKVVKRTNAYTLLKIWIDTGKKNQIRVQLSDIGHPIVGDKKYGAKKNPMGRMGLHEVRLDIKFQSKSYSWVSSVPKEFKKMFEGEELWNVYKK